MVNIICLIAIGLYPSSAYAYMDPLSGSVILQSIIGAIAASLFFLKTYWYKLKRFLKNIKTRKRK